MKSSETITAIATAPGMGAVAMIRVSGPEAFQIVGDIFQTKKGKQIDLSAKKPYSLYFGEIRDAELVLDEVLIAIFKNPHSYTGEDTVEITCHGSVYIQQQILQLLYRKGARAADPGEFTMKAFFNGKMDLSQAEAVADLISSENSAAHSIAMNQMRGKFSNRIQELRKELIAFASLIELELDFAEEDVEFADRIKFLELVSTILKEIHLLIESFSVGNAIKNGIPVVIAGKPNVGKSTLLNAILQDERAIVSEIAGTTRDTIEDEFTIEGIKFRFIDTAGIRHTEDTIEAIGVERTHQKIKQSAIVLYLFDLHETTLHELEDTLQKMKDENEVGKFIIPIGNKVDKENIAAIRHEFEHIPEIIFISAKQHENLDELKARLIELSGSGKVKSGDTIVSNARHVDALYRSKLALEKVQEGMSSDLPTDLIAVDLKQALNSLGEITGEISTDDLLESIFRNFCIGK